MRVPEVVLAGKPVEVFRQDENGVLIKAHVTAGRRWQRLTYNGPRFRSADAALLWLNTHGNPEHVYVLVPFHS